MTVAGRLLTGQITTGWIKSYGQAWWDLNPVNGTGTPARPHLMQFNVTNGVMQHFKSSKPIAWNLQVLGSTPNCGTAWAA